MENGFVVYWQGPLSFFTFWAPKQAFADHCYSIGDGYHSGAEPVVLRTAPNESLWIVPVARPWEDVA